MRRKTILKEGLKFIWGNKSIFYSLLLIVLIPLFLFFNTYFIIQGFRSVFDDELQQRALALERIIGTFLAEELNEDISSNLVSLVRLQERIALLRDRTNDSDISDLVISVPNETTEKFNGFRIIAAFDPNAIGEELSDPLNFLSWHQDQPFARIASIEGKRFWLVTKPVYVNGKKIALANMAMSLARADSTIKDIIDRAYYILIAMTAFVILLIANHTRMFEYVRLFRRLQEVDRMKDEFISIASHELRGPITGIRNFLSLALDGSYGKMSKDLREGIEQTISEVESLRNLVEDLLNVSRIEQGRIKIASRVIDLREIVHTSVKQIESQAEEKSLKLTLTQPEDPLKVKVDPDRLREIVVNLLTNSVKYTLKGKIEVTINVDQSKKQAILVVKDTGIGMSAEEQRNLFQKFYRVRSSETRNIKGTGLGLWITKRLVELMDGSLSLESMKGVGTQITVRLPLYQPKRKTRKRAKA